jgi:hypothetical protein
MFGDEYNSVMRRMISASIHHKQTGPPQAENGLYAPE